MSKWHFDPRGVKKWTAHQVETVLSKPSFAAGPGPRQGDKLPEPDMLALREEGPADQPLSPQTPLSPLYWPAGELAKTKARAASKAPTARPVENSNRSLCLCLQGRTPWLLAGNATVLGCLPGEPAKDEARAASEAPADRLAENSNRKSGHTVQGRGQTAGASQEGSRKLKPGLQAKRQSLGQRKTRTRNRGMHDHDHHHHL